MRKRPYHKISNENHKNTKCKIVIGPEGPLRVPLLDSFNINSINDLVELAKTLHYYKNIDMIMLWKLLPYLEQINDLIGMNELKETIFFQIIYYLQKMHLKSNEEYLHTVIIGKPGYGKTSVSKIIGKIYQSMGILSANGKIKIAYRDDFVAEYLGKTAIKTRLLLESCVGGVLIIDECYSFGCSGSGSKDFFAKEAIDTLNSFLDIHKNDLCCIIVGYEEEIEKCFFSINAGLKRRFSWTHRIKDYNEKELGEIFIKKIKEINWSYIFEKNYIDKIIKDNKDIFKYGGGSIETFLSKCKMLHSKRVFLLDNHHKFILTEKDIENSIEYLKLHKKKEKENIPYGMYL
jgi:hypothetical protein